MPHKIHIAPPYEKDERVVLTLDAGGTKFSFSAMAGGKQVTHPIEFPSHGDDLEKCLKTLVGGFAEIQSRLHDKLVQRRAHYICCRLQFFLHMVGDSRG